METTIPAIQDAIEDHVVTAEQLVRMYHKRIAAYDGETTAAHLNAYIHLNRHALTTRPMTGITITTAIAVKAAGTGCWPASR